MSTRNQHQRNEARQLYHSPYSAACNGTQNNRHREIEMMGESGRLFWFFTSDSRAIARKVSESWAGQQSGQNRPGSSCSWEAG